METITLDTAKTFLISQVLIYLKSKPEFSDEFICSFIEKAEETKMEELIELIRIMVPRYFSSYLV